MSKTVGTSSSRDFFSEIVHNDNRAFVVKRGPNQPSLNFPQTQQRRRKYTGRFQKKKKKDNKNSGAYLGGALSHGPHFNSAF